MYFYNEEESEQQQKLGKYIPKSELFDSVFIFKFFLRFLKRILLIGLVTAILDLVSIFHVSNSASFYLCTVNLMFVRPYSRRSRTDSLFFISSSSSITFTRLSGPRSRPTPS
jgi:hypothetical protein